MLGDTLFDDILDALAESADTSRPIFDMIWEDSSFFGMLQNSAPGLTWDPMGVFGASSESNLTSLAPTSYGAHSLEAEISIIHAMTGIEVSTEELLKEAIARGWYNEGILPEHLGKALSLYDIAYHINENGTTADIMRELVYGRKMIVALDMSKFLSNDIRFLGTGIANVKETISDMLGMRTCDQAVWITDVDSSDPNDIKIVINDTTVAGTSEKIYSLSDSWRLGMIRASIMSQRTRHRRTWKRQPSGLTPRLARSQRPPRILKAVLRGSLMTRRPPSRIPKISSTSLETCIGTLHSHRA
jgi:hypothetical protein